MTPYYQTKLKNGKLTSESDSAESDKDTSQENNKARPLQVSDPSWFDRIPKKSKSNIDSEAPKVSDEMILKNIAA